LNRVNACREQAGLKPVKLSDDLSLGCQVHARYLLLNAAVITSQGLNPHEELPTLNGFSQVGRQAAHASVISGYSSKPPEDWPAHSVDLWLGSFYHRVPILNPSLKMIGFGYATDGQAWKVVMDVESGARRPSSAAKGPVVVYPVDEQEKVPRIYAKGTPETPSPIPDDRPTGTVGFPITAQFPPGTKVTGVVATLSATPAKKTAEAGATEVPIWLSSPAFPAVANVRQRNTVCLIPKAPLAANLTYRVTIAAKVDGKPWNRTWTFTTGEE
jgi:hypothetical protein